MTPRKYNFVNNVPLKYKHIKTASICNMGYEMMSLVLLPKLYDGCNRYM